MPESRKLNTDEIRKDFPILSRTVNGKPLIYFDSGATAQKPKVVIDAITDYYSRENSNIHRGVHTLSREITNAYEHAREVIRKHINAKEKQEIVFTSGTTEGINLVAFNIELNLQEGDEILVTEMEHHSNILPWQSICKRKGAKLKALPVDDHGHLRIDLLKEMLTPKTKLFAFCHVSNTLGTVNPVKELTAMAHAQGVPVLIDAAQSAPHMAVDVQDIDCDFLVFSGHKTYGPTGVGILYGKQKHLFDFQPWQTGGGTILDVSFDHTEYAESPLRFEAGTPNIEGGIGLATAITYMNSVGLNHIEAHEKELLKYAELNLELFPEITIYGPAHDHAGVLSFNFFGIHPFDIGTLLDQQGIAVRTGHHCTQPLMKKLGIPGTVRLSVGMYNTPEEIDSFLSALKKSLKMLR